MTIEQIAADLRSHMDRSEQHYREMKEHKMTTQPVNIFEPSGGNMGGVLGGGLGAGVLGGVLGGALLGNNNGLFGNRNGFVGEGVVTPAQLTAALNGVTESNNTTQVLQTLGDIKAAVPLAEAQVQLAIAGATSETTRAIAATENLLVQGQAGINSAIAGVNVNVLQSAAQTREAIATYGNANLIATKEAATAAALAVANSTKEIIAALNDQNTANLQRQLTVAEQALFEQRAESRARGTEVNVTQTVSQNQAQAQAQAQQQQQAILLSNIWQRLDGMQNAIATNSNLIVGNSGATTTGAQTANPVNVRT